MGYSHLGAFYLLSGGTVLSFDVAIWGTVANWFSGGATATAASIALYVALSNKSKDRKDKRAALVREAEVENALLAECLSMYRSIRQATDDVVDQFRRQEISFDSWRFFMRQIRERSLRLQQMPLVNIRAYQELEHVIEMTRHDDEIRIMDMGDVEELMKSIVYSCNAANERLIETPNPNAILKW